MIENFLQIIIALGDLQPVKDFFSGIPFVVMTCTIITAVTATRWPDNPVMDKIFHVLNILAGNVLKNKNADAEGRNKSDGK